MMAALAELHAHALTRLEAHPQARTVYAAEPRANDNFSGHKLFCRETVFSLAASGVPVKCLLIDQRSTHKLLAPELDLILGFVASLVDFSVSQVADQPAMKRAQARLTVKKEHVDRVRRGPGPACEC